MRKLLLIILLSGAFVAKAQVTLATNWSLLAPGSSQITANTGSSVAYNPSTQHLLFPDRNNKVSILSPADGTTIKISGGAPKELKTDASWSSDGFKYNKIRVDADGVIYAINLITPSGNLSIYRWANEDDQAPTRTQFSMTARMGDSFGLYGTGDNTRLYVSGSGSDKIYVYRVTGGVITQDRVITITTGWARSSISPISENELIIAGPSGTLVRKVTTAAGGTTLLAGTVTISKQNSAFANAEYFVDGAKKYITVHGAVVNASLQQIGMEFEVYNITDIANPSLVTKSTLMTPPVAQNGSAYADVAVLKNADQTFTFFHTVLANGLASYTSNTTLPVSLTSFDAALINGQSTLSWQTASEVKNKGFEVLRSNDGSNFSPVGFVNSKAQNGNSSEVLNYSFVDRTAKAGENYYKLRQVDLDGGEKLFDKVVSVKLSFDGNSVVAFPNPTTKYVTVNAGTNDYSAVKYELFDVSGRRVLSESAKAAQQELSLSGLPASIYYLRISKNNELQKTVKLIKQ